MLVVISPAKTLDYSPLRESIGFSEPLFIDKTESLVKEMRNYDAEMLSSLMKISENLGFLNFERFQTWKQDSAPGVDSKQSVFAFQGDVYKGLDISSLDKDVVDYSQKYLRILSGLYGLLKPLDLIAPYRLEMGTKLKIGDSSNLYEFWKPHVTNAINKDLKIQKTNFLINLASNEYFSVLEPNNVEAEIISPVFKDFKNGDYKIISFHAKKARGLMTRFIMTNNIKDPADIKKFDYEGYKYSSKLSKEKFPVFFEEALNFLRFITFSVLFNFQNIFELRFSFFSPRHHCLSHIFLRKHCSAPECIIFKTILY